MVRIPAFESNPQIGIGGVVQSSVNSQTSNGLSNVGGALLNAGEEMRQRDERARAKLEAQRQRDANLSIEQAVIESKLRWDEELRKRTEEMPEGGRGFSEGFSKYVSEDVTKTLQEKFPTWGETDLAPARIAFSKATDGYLNKAAENEYAARLEWRKNVFNSKLEDLKGSLTLDPSKYAEAEGELNSFLERTIGPGRVNDYLRETGVRELERAAAASKAQSDLYGARTAFNGAYPNLPVANAAPEIKSVVEGANDIGYDPGVMLGIGRLESNFDPNAKPVGKDGKVSSSAAGVFQVLNSESTLKALGLTAEDRKDTRKVAKALGAYLQRQEARVKQMGQKFTPGVQYMFWNVGEGLAANILRASSTDLIEDVVRRTYANKDPAVAEKVLNNNPSMYKAGMTVGQVRAAYESKMAGAMASTRQYLVDGEKLDAAIAAKKAFTDFLGFEPKYLDNGDAAEIMASVQKEIQEREKKGEKSRMGAARLSGEAPYDPEDSEHRNEVNEALAGSDVAQRIARGDPEAHVDVRIAAETLRSIPAPWASAYNELILSKGNDAAKIQAFQTLTEITEDRPYVLRTSKIDEEAEKRLKDYNVYVNMMGVDPATAMRKIDAKYSPEGRALRQSTDDMVDKELKKVTSADLLREFSSYWTFGEQFNSLKVEATLSSTYETLYRDYRSDNNDASEAHRKAIADIRKNWGFSRTASQSGDPSFMPYPPENYYSQFDDSHDWISRQAKNFASNDPMVKRSASKGLTVEDVALVPRIETARAARNKQGPMYEVWVRFSDGTVDKTDEPWFKPDENAAYLESVEQLSVDQLKKQRDLARKSYMRAIQR